MKERKKKKGPTKTTQYLKILHYVATSKQKCISEDQLHSFLGEASRSKMHRDVKELTLGSADVPGLLVETKNSETGEVSYCFNHEGWQAFLDSRTEGKFLLECYRKTGYLLDSNFANMVFELEDEEKKDTDNIARKFLHLVKVRAHRTEHTKDILDTVIEAIIKQKQVEITYEGGVRILRPYTLLSHRDELYVLGDRKKGESLLEPRMFKLTRISKVKLLSIGFKYPDLRDWDPMKFYEKSTGLMVGEEGIAQIKVYGHSRKILGEKDFFQGQKTNFDEESDTYTIKYSHPNEFLGQLFVYAQDIEILGDEVLKKAFVEKAQAALSRNSTSLKKIG